MKLFTDFLLMVFIIACAEILFASSITDAPTATNFFDTYSPTSTNSLTANYSPTVTFSPITCAAENEKSTGCGSKKGKSMCCPGLVCHEIQYWRCVRGKIFISLTFEKDSFKVQSMLTKIK